MAHCDSQSALQLQRADATDAKLLATLNWHLILDEGHRNQMTQVELEDRMHGWLDSGEYEAVLFQLDQQPIGYALFRRETEHVYLRQFFINQQNRRRGFGRQAMSWLTKHCWSGRDRLRLDVLSGNHDAIAFYRAIGFSDYCVTMECDITDMQQPATPAHQPDG